MDGLSLKVNLREDKTLFRWREELLQIIASYLFRSMNKFRE